MEASLEVRFQDDHLVPQAARDLVNADPTEVLRWALTTYGDAFCLTTSLADAVLVDMASKIRSGVNVLFVDTGYHFAETLRTRAELVARYPIRLMSATPRQTVPQQDTERGRSLFKRDPDLCCQLRKVEPMDDALSGFRAWASGIRRDESTTRTDVGVVEWDSRRSMVKVNPLATWTQSDVEDYITANDVLVNPLLAEGFVSIGCAPCTRAVAPGEDARSGRWAGLEKTECGLHTL
jgi:phosphoadenosine phosphosulfate reductase